ncbi:rCG26026 [Rattus norvegicus]|uniref:RCG26026 n=1 Tax=Rattus norvegicus TaxID=10116 RepID=A6I2A8_RAT|nr:rCG26026 [Rattus norvegicus]
MSQQPFWANYQGSCLGLAAPGGQLPQDSKSLPFPLRQSIATGVLEESSQHCCQEANVL